MASKQLSQARSKAVLVTGASSGLGRAAATHLSDLGYRVFAGVRSSTSATELANVAATAGELIPVMIDVTDADSIAEAGAVVERQCADIGLWAVVNNAGTALSAPLECVPIDVLRSHLETNLVGTLAITQQFLPFLRGSKGRIVNISSGIGSVAPPYMGAYAASQFAKEGMSDALRRELRPLGVSVSVIQPGAINTPIWAKMRESADKVLANAPGDVADAYRDQFTAFLEFNEARAGEAKTTPADFAATVAAALAARRPRVRYRVGADSRSTALARRLVPDSMMDRVFAAVLKSSARPRG